MIIIGLKSWSCGTGCSAMYVHKYAHNCTHEWMVKTHIAVWFWNWKEWFISVKKYKRTCQLPSSFFHTHNTKDLISWKHNMLYYSAVASYLRDSYESGIALLLLSARKQISILPQISNYSFNVKMVHTRKSDKLSSLQTYIVFAFCMLVM